MNIIQNIKSFPVSVLLLLGKPRKHTLSIDQTHFDSYHEPKNCVQLLHLHQYYWHFNVENYLVDTPVYYFYGQYCMLTTGPTMFKQLHWMCVSTHLCWPLSAGTFWRVTRSGGSFFINQVSEGIYPFKLLVSASFCCFACNVNTNMATVFCWWLQAPQLRQ